MSPDLEEALEAAEAEDVSAEEVENSLLRGQDVTSKEEENANGMKEEEESDADEEEAGVK